MSEPIGKWFDGRYSFAHLRLASWLRLSVGWSMTGGGYKWSSSVGVSGTKKYDDARSAQIAAERWARKALAEAAAQVPKEESK